MSPKRIQDEFTYLYDKVEESGKKRVARILYELRRYARGLCIYPGCKEAWTVGKYCNLHRAKIAAKQRKWYKRRKR